VCNKRFGLVLAAIVAASTLAAPVLAADAPPSLGLVDVQAVLEGYEKTKRFTADLEAFGKQIDDQFATLSSVKLLDDNDRKELSALVTKPNATDKDKERIKALQDKETELAKQLADLAAKKEPTEQEKALMKELQDRSARAEEAITQTGQESQKQFNAKKDELTKEVRNDIVKAIEEVAKQKGLTFVVDKVAVLYGGTDITGAVLERLNKKK